MTATHRSSIRGIVDTLRSVVRFQPLELDPVTRRLRRAANVADLRRIAKRRLPHGVFDYIDGGAEDERSLAANTAAFAAITFQPRVLAGVGAPDPSTTLLGETIPVPIVMAPTGFTRLAHSQGELAVARAAARAGVPFTLSTLATYSIEEVAAVSDGTKWFQVYVWRDRGLVREMIQRAADCGYKAIMPTVDTTVFGRRERDVRRGFALPPKVGLGTLLDGAVHPAWTWDFVRAEPIRFANVTGAATGVEHGDGTTAVTLADYVNEQFDPTLTWDDIDWLRTCWDGPIIVKGIQSVADARVAAERGIEAIVISNHGGRQLDGSPATIEQVAPTVDAVGDRVEVLVDGGVRRGSDVVKAVALGAKAVMIGRAYSYALGAAGERGVDHVLGLLDADVRRTMALLGAHTIADLHRDLLELP